ncbi:hypothetical protein Bbelb_392580 [Branchiostoma belcheri]|nr:hypothetical protein Bbelb_392580 [Branchiostoma belcheri]
MNHVRGGEGGVCEGCGVAGVTFRCVKHAVPRWRERTEGKNERVKIRPRKTRHARFGAHGKLRLYLTMFLCVLWDYMTMFLCVLWDLSVFLSIFPEESEELLVCVPDGPVTYQGDKRTSDLNFFKSTSLLSPHLIRFRQESLVITGFSQSGQECQDS